MRGNHWVEVATGKCVEASPASMAKRHAGVFVGDDGNAASNAEWLWLPDLSAVEGEERQHWRVVDGAVVACSQEEKDAIVAARKAAQPATLEDALARIAELEKA